MKCHACDRTLSNDPKAANFGLWTSTEPRWSYCAPLMICPGCGCGWQEATSVKSTSGSFLCPECGSRLHEAEGDDLSAFCARVTLREHAEGQW